jgi:hypothetical protein
MEQQRQEYAAYSPVFWRPAKNVIDLHAQFLRGLISSETTIALRTDGGFIICQRRGDEGFVDDFAVKQPGSWNGDGAALLLAVAEKLRVMDHPAELRVVTAHADQPKLSMLASLSLRLVEQWWVRELRPVAQSAVPGRITGPGFSGLFGPAPPVYDPGGLVFLAKRVGEDADIAVIEHQAAALGAVLAIVPAAPGTIRADELQQQGWRVAPDWYLGSPVSPATPRVRRSDGSSDRAPTSMSAWERLYIREPEWLQVCCQ